jgi:hypothetical protein
MGIIPSLVRATPRSLTQIARFLLLTISGTYDGAQKLTCTRPDKSSQSGLEPLGSIRYRPRPSSFFPIFDHRFVRN